MNLLIIADDFTGALDTGVQISRHSIRTTVLTSPDIPDMDPDACQVLVINANTRHCTPLEAFEITQKLLKTFYKDTLYVYIKTDSALRGNLSAALSAALTVTGKSLCFVPAFPAAKRTTKDAYAYVDETLLEHSVFRNDPRTPATESYIPNIITRDFPISWIHLKNSNQIACEATEPQTLYLFDCQTDEQLKQIGHDIAKKGLYQLTAGCAGFASTFHEHLPLTSCTFPDTKSNSPVLFVSGSANAVTLKQIQYARKHGYKIFSLAKSIKTLYNCTTKSEKNVNFYTFLINNCEVGEICSELNNGKSVIIATAIDDNDLSLFHELQNSGKNTEELHNCIARLTSCLVQLIMKEISIENLAVFGGDTVYAILKELNCRQVEAKGEISTGVPLCGFSHEGIYRNLVTKSGGFGTTDIVPVIEQYLR